MSAKTVFKGGTGLAIVLINGGAAGAHAIPSAIGLKIGDEILRVQHITPVAGTGGSVVDNGSTIALADSDRVIAGVPGLAIGSTDTSIATGLIYYVISSAFYTKAAVAAGTALAAGTIPQDKWGIYRVVIGADGTIDVLAGAANFTTGYADEAAAIAALPAVTASHADLGYFTVLTAVGSAFIGNTDGLQGGSSGNVSSDTNYYPAGLTLPTATPTIALTLTQGAPTLTHADLTSEFTSPVEADDAIDNTGGTATTNDWLLVVLNLLSAGRPS